MIYMKKENKQLMIKEMI